MKLYYYLIAFIGFMFASCQKQDLEMAFPDAPSKGVKIEFLGEDSQPLSRSTSGKVEFPGGYALGAGIYHTSRVVPVSVVPDKGYTVDFFYGGPSSSPKKYDYASKGEKKFDVDLAEGDHTFKVKFKKEGPSHIYLNITTSSERPGGAFTEYITYEASSPSHSISLYADYHFVYQLRGETWGEDNDRDDRFSNGNKIPYYWGKQLEEEVGEEKEYGVLTNLKIVATGKTIWDSPRIPEDGILKDNFIFHVNDQSKIEPNPFEEVTPPSPSLPTKYFYVYVSAEAPGAEVKVYDWGIYQGTATEDSPFTLEYTGTAKVTLEASSDPTDNGMFNGFYTIENGVFTKKSTSRKYVIDNPKDKTTYNAWWSEGDAPW